MNRHTRIIAPALALLVAGGLYAQAEKKESWTKRLNVGIGGGLYFANGFGGGYMGYNPPPGGSGDEYGYEDAPYGYPSYPYYDGYYDSGSYDSTSQSGAKKSYKMPFWGLGLFLFFDTTYAEASLGALYVGLSDSPATFNVNLALLGKYPVKIDKDITAFPLLGIDYQAAPSKYGSFSALWFKGGGGFDYAASKNMFVRVEALYGVRLPNEYEERAGSPLPGHGFTIKLGGGQRM